MHIVPRATPHLTGKLNDIHMQIKPGDKSMKADPEGSLEYFSSGATEESEADPLQAGPKVVTAKDAKHFKVRATRSVVGGVGGAVSVRGSVMLISHHLFTSPQALLAKHPKVVVDFVAGWCGKCIQMFVKDECDSDGWNCSYIYACVFLTHSCTLFFPSNK